MNFKLAFAALAMGSMFLALPGCATDTTDDAGEDDSSGQEDVDTSQDEVRAGLVGHYNGRSGGSITFKSNGTFVWETISGQRLTGRFTTAGNRITLGSAGSHYYFLSGKTLRLRKVGAPADAVAIYTKA